MSHRGLRGLILVLWAAGLAIVRAEDQAKEQAKDQHCDADEIPSSGPIMLQAGPTLSPRPLACDLCPSSRFVPRAKGDDRGNTCKEIIDRVLKGKNMPCAMARSKWGERCCAPSKDRQGQPGGNATRKQPLACDLCPSSRFMPRAKGDDTGSTCKEIIDRVMKGKNMPCAEARSKWGERCCAPSKDRQGRPGRRADDRQGDRKRQDFPLPGRQMHLEEDPLEQPDGL